MKKYLVEYFSALLMILSASVAFAQAPAGDLFNGFDVSNSSVPLEEIFQGGPPREGIPAIDAPKFSAVAETTFLRDDDRLVGVVLDGTAKAYPIRILNWHEVVNDQIGDQAFSVTYCPLCGSGMAFAAEVADRQLNFGVSGLLFDNNMLLFDRNTQSLWSQMMGEAISGELQGNKLRWLPIVHTTWGDWKKRYPQSQVLTTDTGHVRDYTDNPYELYEQVGMIYFPQRNIAPKTYGAHEPVLGLQVGDTHKAYAYAELSKNGKDKFRDSVNGTELWIYWDQKNRSASVRDAQGRDVAAAVSYWFAWYSFYPQTLVFKAAK